jgi:hypothetical protein
MIRLDIRGLARWKVHFLRSLRYIWNPLCSVSSVTLYYLFCDINIKYNEAEINVLLNNEARSDPQTLDCTQRVILFNVLLLFRFSRKCYPLLHFFKDSLYMYVCFVFVISHKYSPNIRPYKCCVIFYCQTVLHTLIIVIYIIRLRTKSHNARHKKQIILWL